MGESPTLRWAYRTGHTGASDEILNAFLRDIDSPYGGRFPNFPCGFDLRIEFPASQRKDRHVLRGNSRRSGFHVRRQRVFQELFVLNYGISSRLCHEYFRTQEY